jgi:hypothetical protein
MAANTRLYGWLVSASQKLKTFDSVPPKNINGLDTTSTLQEDISRYFTLDGKPANVSPSSGYEYYFVVYFAKYFSRMSKESFHQLQKR